jgi:hypothetical protein
VAENIHGHHEAKVCGGVHAEVHAEVQMLQEGISLQTHQILCAASSTSAQQMHWQKQEFGLQFRIHSELLCLQGSQALPQAGLCSTQAAVSPHDYSCR